MRIDDFYVGQSASLKKTFDSDEVALFAALSLDKNPLYNSDKKEVFCSKT